MPTPTLAERQHKLIDEALSLFVAADALRDDANDDEFNFHPEYDDDLDVVGLDDLSGLVDFGDREAVEMLEIVGATWFTFALQMEGDGSRGSYFKFPRSTDFFSCCLQLPDRQFRFMFR